MRAAEARAGGLKDGDIFLAHMGIWSRKDPWAPANLEPLISRPRAKRLLFRYTA
jgi:hypothetical protein